LTVIGQFLTLTASSILLLLIVDDALDRFYNRVVSRKPQEIDQSQSNLKRIIDYDWLISCGLQLMTLL